MINIVVHYKQPDTPSERITASYTKIRGNFYCIHFITEKGKPFRSKFIPADVIDFIEQEDSGKRNQEDDDDDRSERES